MLQSLLACQFSLLDVSIELGPCVSNIACLAIYQRTCPCCKVVPGAKLRWTFFTNKEWKSYFHIFECSNRVEIFHLFGKKPSKLDVHFYRFWKITKKSRRARSGKVTILRNNRIANGIDSMMYFDVRVVSPNSDLCKSNPISNNFSKIEQLIFMDYADGVKSHWMQFLLKILSRDGESWYAV